MDKGKCVLPVSEELYPFFGSIKVAWIHKGSSRDVLGKCKLSTHWQGSRKEVAKGRGVNVSLGYKRWEGRNDC